MAAVSAPRDRTGAAGVSIRIERLSIEGFSARDGRRVQDGFAAGAFAGDGCVKKNDVMGFSTFFELPPPEAGLPRFILARPAGSRPRVARPTEWPLL